MDQNSSVGKIRGRGRGRGAQHWRWGQAVQTPGMRTLIQIPIQESSAAIGDNAKQRPNKQTEKCELDKGPEVAAADVQQPPIPKPRSLLPAPEQNQNTKVNPFLTVIADMVGDTKINPGNSKPLPPPVAPRTTVRNSVQGPNLAAQKKGSPDKNKNILPNPLAAQNTQTDSQNNMPGGSKQSQPQQSAAQGNNVNAVPDQSVGENKKTVQQSPGKNVNDGNIQPKLNGRNNPPGSSGSGQVETQVSPITATVDKVLQNRPRKNSHAKVDPFFERHHALNTEVGKHFDLEQQLHIFVRETTMNPNEIQRRVRFLDELLGLIRPLFQFSLLYPFGSFVTKLGDLDSDVDIFVDAYGTTMENGYVRLPQEEKAYIFETIFRGLRRSHRYFKQVIQIPHARVPIIKLVHLSTNVNADLSFENLMSVQNSKLIAFYVNFEPRVRPLLLIIRYWARFHLLSGCNLVKNYGLVLMALAFLMRKKLIPTVHLLQVLAPRPLLIENWNAAFCQNTEMVKHCPAFWNRRQPMKDFSGPPNVREVLLLAQEFFDIFANLDYANEIICSLTGDFLPRESFKAENEEKLPPELDRYKSWAQTQEPDQRLDINSVLCIQDPFNLGFNVGGCTKQQILVKFIGACVSASTQLTKILAEDSPKLMDLFIPLSPEFSKPTRKEKYRAKLVVQAALAAAQKAGTDDKEKDTSTKNVPESGVPIPPTPTSRVPDKRESVTLKLMPNQDYNIQCHVLTKRLITRFTPPDFLDSLFDGLWLKFMYDFLKTVLQQAYKLDVRLEDCICKEYFRDQRAQQRKKTQSESSNVKTPSSSSDRTDGNDGKDCEMSPNRPINDQNEGETSSQDVEMVPSRLTPGKDNPNDAPTTSLLDGQPSLEPKGHGGGSQRVPPELTDSIRPIPFGRGRGRGRNPKRHLSSHDADIPEPGSPNSESTHKLLKPSVVTPPPLRNDKEGAVEFNLESSDSEGEGKVDSKSETTESTKMDTKSERSESPTAESKSADDDDPEIDDGDKDEHLHLDVFHLYCTGTFQVWEGRKKNRKVANKTGIIGITDPIQVEADVTQLLLDQAYGGVIPKTPIFKFNMVVHVGDEGEVDDPVFLIRLTEELLPGGLKMNRQALGYFGGNVLKSLSSSYVKYRLDKWFLTEGGKEIIIRAGEPPSTLN